MRVILIGYGELASALMLGMVESGHEIVGVLKWDMSKNKLLSPLKKLLLPDNFESLIKTYKIPEICANSVNSNAFLKIAKQLNPDIIMVGAWGEILEEKVINLPKVACVNCHPSLLPKHRGSNPYASVLIEGDTQTGVSFHLMSKAVDAGPILLQKPVLIAEDDNAYDLRTKCTFKAKEMVGELLNKLEKVDCLPQEQDESQATYYPRLSIDDAVINWNRPAEEIHNQIRGITCWIKCYTMHGDEFLMIKGSKIVKLDNFVSIPGKILAKYKNNLIVSTKSKDKAIQIQDVKLYGFAASIRTKFFLSNKIKIGDYLKSAP